MCFAAIGALGCGSEEERVSWRYIQPAIVMPGCATATCHGSMSTLVDLESFEESYATLLDGGFVVPGEPEESRLVYLLRGIEVRKAMPPDQPLASGDVDLIVRWIEAGAPLE